MPNKPFSLYTQCHNSDTFSLSIKHEMVQTKIIMKMHRTTVNTRDIPQTFSLLKKTIPTILESICYNEDNTPFYREVVKTELGHLFEHILIEYLCLLKIANGYDDAEFSGTTAWNWVVYPMGSFHITVTAGYEDHIIFKEAMEKTIALFNTILSSNTHLPQTDPYVLPSGHSATITV